MQTKRLIYLASPYTNTDFKIMEKRYIQICQIAGELIREKGNEYLIFCPIAMSHGIAIHNRLCHKWKFWEAQDLGMLDLAKELWVVTLPGWNKSTGVMAEIKHALSMGKRVEYLDPNDYINMQGEEVEV